ncbi:MAG TPA: HD domain-containing phosphohydrolase [Vicinamibacteria bacterium]|jgi:response regulator RpfG family c-di-GMP phosphodiesterase
MTNGHDLRQDASTGREVLKVLLVDDHAPVLRFLALAFKSNGCVVSTAASAEEAFDLLSLQPFDLVVSDIKMPGLSGLDVLRAVKGRQPGTPVVLITGMPSVDSAVFGLRNQAFDYLTKPFSVEDVHHLLQRIREERRSRPPAAPALAPSQDAARRQAAVEGLSHLGDLALQGLDPVAFLDQALTRAMESLGGDAVCLLLEDAPGAPPWSEKGDPTLAARVRTRADGWLGELKPVSAKSAAFSVTDPAFVSLASVVPGVRGPAGLLCLARRDGGELLPDEKEFLLGYARTIGLSLEKMVLGESLEGNLVDTISSFVIALESKDVYLKGHSARVALYAAEIARVMQLSEPEIAVVERAAMLHDLGKLVVGDAILRKPTRLSNEETAALRQHPTNAARILAPFRFLAREAEALRAHHERYDGKGYPSGLKGEEIPLAARIIAVADAFDAMTSSRPYRNALPFEVAIGEIRRHERAQFDPSVTEAFSRISSHRLVDISRLYDARAEKLSDGGSASVPEALLGASFWRRQEGSARC